MLTFRRAVRSGPRRVLAWLGFEGVAGTANDHAVAELPPDLVETLVAPRYGIDGWTYQGTELEECFPPDVEPEIAALAHAVGAGLTTSWGYEQVARLLERHGAYGQAYAVIQAHIDQSTAQDAIPDSSLMKWRARLAQAVLAQGECGTES
jgi:hypothetical protein